MDDLEKGDKGSQSSTADKVSRPVPKPRSNCLLGFCRLINFLTAICCLLCAVAHGMALMVGEGSVQARFMLQLLLASFFTSQESNGRFSLTRHWSETTRGFYCRAHKLSLSKSCACMVLALP